MERLTDYKVLESTKGFYIGREYFDEQDNFYRPYDRISAEHWETKEEAEEALVTGNFTSKTWT